MQLGASMTLEKAATLMKSFAVIASIAVYSPLSLSTLGCNDKPSVVHDEGEKAGAAREYEKGPHGGRLLSDEQFQAEVTIYERGVPPQFRVYFYDQGKLVLPGEVALRIDLHRLGGRVDRIGFTPEQDYLVGDQVVEEPHSFDVDVTAERGGTKHTWQYSQTEGRVILSEDAVRTSAIQIETAGPVTMRSVLEVPGEITFNGDKVAHLVPRVSGVIHEIRKNQGDAVTKGEVIAVIDSRDLAETKRHFIETANQLHFARRAFEREEGLWKKNIASEASYLTYERAYQEARLQHQSARQQLEALGIDSDALDALLDKPGSTLTRYELRAPFDGVVIEKKVAIGQAVKDDDDLFTFADLSTVWVNVTVYTKDLNAVKVGQEVTVKSDALGTEAPGKIVYLGSLVGEATRSAVARVVLPDPEGRWRPGLFVNVSVVQKEVTVPVAVKRDGLQRFRDWDVVFVRVGDLFEARPLELGRKDGEWVEVLSGLSPGEKYAAANSFILKADVGKTGASHDH
jgi:cobalt-zinc-cadmium efflux system membrane fusion protein